MIEGLLIEFDDWKNDKFFIISGQICNTVLLNNFAHYRQIIQFFIFCLRMSESWCVILRKSWHADSVTVQESKILWKLDTFQEIAKIWDKTSEFGTLRKPSWIRDNPNFWRTLDSLLHDIVLFTSGLWSTSF